MKKALILLAMLSTLITTQINSQESIHFDTGEIPFEMVKNAIVISVQIEGETFRFVLDTGGGLMISKPLQRKFGFQSVEGLRVSDVSKNERIFDRVLIPKIRIGNAEFENAKAIVAFGGESYPDSCFNTDGMIGRDFFTGKILHMDYKRSVVRLADDETLFELKEEYKAPLRISDRGLPDVQVVIDGKKEFVEFDSGSGDFFSFKSKKAKRLRKKKDKEKLRFKGVFSFGVSKKSYDPIYRYKVKLNRFVLGKTMFKDFYSDFSKATAPRIGASILYYGAVTVDYKNLGFYFQPYKTIKPIPAFETFGFDVAYINEQYVIKWVLEGSKAEKKGLRYGMPVLKINGKALPHKGTICDAYINGYSFTEADEVSIEYLDTNNELQVISLEKMKF